MVWAKAALAGGLLLVLAAFAVGTEKQLSASVMGQAHDCGPSISASWLVSGTPVPSTEPGSTATDDERRTAAACRSVVHQYRVLVVTAIGIGGLLALAGWSAIRAPRERRPQQKTPVAA